MQKTLNLTTDFKPTNPETQQEQCKTNDYGGNGCCSWIFLVASLWKSVQTNSTAQNIHIGQVLWSNYGAHFVTNK